VLGEGRKTFLQREKTISPKVMNTLVDQGERKGRTSRGGKKLTDFPFSSQIGVKPTLEGHRKRFQGRGSRKVILKGREDRAQRMKGGVTGEKEAINRRDIEEGFVVRYYS